MAKGLSNQLFTGQDSRLIRLLTSITCATMLALFSCKKPDLNDVAHGFPEDIAPLMRNNCATSGCHEPSSAVGAGGLNLDTWDDLFKGARGGSPVVPYNPEQSYLLQALSTDSSWVPPLYPTMPLNRESYGPLELQRVIDWINAGARNADGEERFPPKADRQKWYVANRFCDQVAVFDAESRQIMRMIEVGSDDISIEEGYDLIISPDKQHWYLVFLYWNPRIEIYNTLTDEKEGEIWLDRTGYSHLATSMDGRFLFALSQWQKRISVVDLDQEQVVFGPYFTNENMAGLAVHPIGNKIYYGSTDTGMLNTLDFDNQGQLSNLRTISLEQQIPSTSSNPLAPHDILFMPDGSKYFVTCHLTNEVRIFDGSNDSLLAVIPTPLAPRTIALAESSQQLFVSCEFETAMHGGNPLKMGTIAVIDYSNNTLEKTIYTGFQPYGIEVDEISGYVIVAHRNLDINAPPSHHGTTCEGNNGNVTLIDLHTLELVPDYKPELSVDPFCVAVKE